MNPRPPATAAAIALSSFLCASLALAQDTTSAQPPLEPAPVAPSATTGSTIVVDAQGNPVTVSSHLPAPPARDHRAAFAAIDADGDGRVSRDETAGDKYLSRAFGALDRDGSGGLDYEELLPWLDD